MAILKSKITFGIVLYNEDLNSSITFQSLVESIENHRSKSNGKVLVLVFDNTPMEEACNIAQKYNYHNNIEVNYYSEGKNKGLPYAYNLFAEKAVKAEKEWLVLLDQDTDLPSDFFVKYVDVDPKFNIQCPLVFSNERLLSPSHYRNFRSSLMTVPETDFISLKNISCINSGLMINLDYYRKTGGYNDKLFLDFCDHDFIDRAKKNGEKNIGILSVKLHQQFSAQVHSKSQALVRYKLFVNDLRQYYKGKNLFKILFLIDLPRILKLIVKYKTLEPLKIRSRR